MSGLAPPQGGGQAEQAQRSGASPGSTAAEANAHNGPEDSHPTGAIGSEEESQEEYSSDEGDEGSAEASSDDEDEQQPLAQRASWAAKHTLPEPTAPAKKRVQRFPKIPAHLKCGKCENCLNPQRKKACTVARQRMMEKQQAAGSTGKPTASLSAAAPALAPGEDPFTRSLTSILSSTGGVVQERHVPLLLQLVRRAKTKPHRTALLAVLQLSATEVLQQAVAGKVLLELQAWLSEFVAEGKQGLVSKVLACLVKLPVTLAALQSPCELGKIVGRLRKHEAFGSSVIEPAKRLVARWKAIVEQEQATKAGSDGGSASASAPSAAKPQAAKPAATKPAAAVAGGPERQSSGNFGGMADGDLFKTTDKQRAGVKDAVPAVKKVVTVKTVTIEATRGRPPADQPPARSDAAKDAAAGSKPSASSINNGTGGATTVGQSAAAASLSTVGISPLASLGSGVTVLGGSTSSGLSPVLSTVGPASNSAKQRAAAAARRVPSPEPQPHKEKKKKVVWVKEDELVGVRWFRKDDPPAAAKQDADASQLARAGSGAGTAPATSAGRERSPPGFESAAKKEHLSEAEALRRHRQEEDEERSDLEQRLARMVATTAWLSPQENDAVSPAELAAKATELAWGEDSTEATAAAARRQQVPPALYPSLAAVPESPAEPGMMEDHGVAQHPATIPRIPLSLEEAAAKQQQQQQQQGGGTSAAAQQQQHAAAIPDIGAALAQLAASGILGPTAGTGGMGPQQQSHQHQHQQPWQQQQQQQQQQQYHQQAPPPRGAPPPPPQQQQQYHQQPPPPRGPLPPQQQARQGPPHSSNHGWQQPGPPQQRPPGPPPPLQQQQQTRRGGSSQRLCRFFNTPQGCFHGDRCNFAHVPQPGGENSRGAGSKRPATEAGLPGHASKQARTSGWQ